MAHIQELITLLVKFHDPPNRVGKALGSWDCKDSSIRLIIHNGIPTGVAVALARNKRLMIQVWEFRALHFGASALGFRVGA